MAAGGYSTHEPRPRAVPQARGQVECGQMTFFEPPPLPPPIEHAPQPRWLGPPENVLGSAVPLGLILGRSEEALVAVPVATAYPEGFEFELDVRVRGKRKHEFLRGPAPWMHEFRRQGTGLPDDLLRYGLEFADGSKVTSLGRFPAFEAAPSPPVLVPRGGGGGDGRWQQNNWVWPLPPEGPLVFVCEWPGVGIALSRVQIDAARLHEASARTEILWETDDSEGGFGGSTGQVMIFSEGSQQDVLPPE